MLEKLVSLCSKNLTDDNVLDVLSKEPLADVLDLSCNSLGDQGVKVVLSSPFIKRVHFLDVSHNNISDEGALALVKSSNTNNIGTLDLKGNRISGDGLMSIAENLPGSKVCFLTVEGNPGSTDPRVIEALYQALVKRKTLIDIRVEDPLDILVPVLIDNMRYIHNICIDFNYRVDILSLDDLKNFEEFYFRSGFRGGLIPLKCRRILNYISDHYFQITRVVRDGLQQDHLNSVSLADLPHVVLREITKYLKISDVKDSV